MSRKALYVVKDCKTTLSKLTTRVAKLKQVLEDILNDDQEMEDMYLGRRAGKHLFVCSQICVRANTLDKTNRYRQVYGGDIVTVARHFC